MEFQILFTAASSPSNFRDGIRLRVLESPVGESTEELLELPSEILATLPPISTRKACAAKRSASGEGHRSRRAVVRKRSAAPRPTRPEEVDSALGAACFRGEIRDRWLGATAASRQADRPLRLTFRFDARCEELGICGWPWERLRIPGGLPPALSRATPVARRIDAVQPPRLPVEDGPLRILLASASPVDQDHLDVQREHQALHRALAGHPAYDLRHVEQVDAASLRRALVEHRPHVFHFIGHGVPDPDGARLVVVDDQTEASTSLEPETVATLLADAADLRLAVLACCHSADTTRLRGDASTALTGLARMLVQVGVPHVVGFHGPVSDVAAWRFARSFYHRIACGDPVELAMVEGRQAVRHAGEDWGKPILFQRAEDGRIQITTEERREPETWSVNRRGAAVLACLALACVALATVAYLGIWTSDALRDAWSVAALAGAVVASSVTRLLHRQGPGSWIAWTWRWPLRRHVVAAVLLAASSLVLLGHRGLEVACAERCGALGCDDPRLDLVVEGAGESAARVRAALTSIDGLRVLGSLEPRFAACVDSRLVVSDGPGNGVRGELLAAGGVLRASAEFLPSNSGPAASRTAVRVRLARWTLERLGLSRPERFSMVPSVPELEPLVRSAHLALARGRAERAGERFGAAISIDPGFAPAHQGLGLARAAAGRPAEGLAALRRAAELAPGVAIFWHSLGQALEDVGDSQSAVDAYRRAISLDPLDSRARNDLGRVYLDLGRTEEAASELGLALGLAVDEAVEAVVRKNVGRLRLAEGRADEALQQLEIARLLHSPYPEATHWRALALERSRPEHACAGWNDLLEEARDPEVRDEARRRQLELKCSP